MHVLVCVPVYTKYLSECEVASSGDIISIFAYEHTTITTILLLRDLLQTIIRTELSSYSMKAE